MTALIVAALFALPGATNQNVEYECHRTKHETRCFVWTAQTESCVRELAVRGKVVRWIHRRCDVVRPDLAD